MADNVAKVVFGDETLIDLTGDTVTPEGVLQGVTFHGKDGRKVQGSIPIWENFTGLIENPDDVIELGEKFFRNSNVRIEIAEAHKLVPENIKAGVSILGVEGTFSPGGNVEPLKEVTPGKEDVLVTPSEGYGSMSAVRVKGIPYREEIDEETGATTVIIG